jgi:hypothetical protein
MSQKSVQELQQMIEALVRQFADMDKRLKELEREAYRLKRRAMNKSGVRPG